MCVPLLANTATQSLFQKVHRENEQCKVQVVCMSVLNIYMVLSLCLTTVHVREAACIPQSSCWPEKHQLCPLFYKEQWSWIIVFTDFRCRQKLTAVLLWR